MTFGNRSGYGRNKAKQNSEEIRLSPGCVPSVSLAAYAFMESYPHVQSLHPVDLSDVFSNSALFLTLHRPFQQGEKENPGLLSSDNSGATGFLSRTPNDHVEGENDAMISRRLACALPKYSHQRKKGNSTWKVTEHLSQSDADSMHQQSGTEPPSYARLC